MRERVDLNVEAVRQFLFVAGLLCGFSFTAIIQVVSGPQRGRMVSLSCVLFYVSSLSFLLAVCLAALLLGDVASLHVGGTPIYDPLLMYRWHLYALVIGPAVFTLGVAMIGWAFSKLVGVLSLVLCLSFLVLLVVAIGAATV